MHLKEKIKEVLDRHKDSQGNMASDSFRDMLAVEIECNITKNMKQLAKDNPLTIEMWKGYNDVTGDQSQLELEI